MNAKALSRLITDIYEAPFDGKPSRDLLARLGKTVDSEITVLIEEDAGLRRASVIDKVGLSDSAIQSYEEYYAARSVLLRESARHREVGRIFCDQMIADYDEYTKSEAYNDFFRPHEADHLFQLHIERSRDWVTALVFRRPRSAGRFRADERRRFSRLTPHLVNAARHSRLLREQCAVRESVIDVLDSMSIPVLLLDADDRVRFANRTGEKLLSQGETLTTRNHRLVATNASDGHRLRKMLRDARRSTSGDHGPPGDCVVSSTSDAACTLTLQAMPVTGPVAERSAAGEAAVMLVASALDREPSANNSLAGLYGLTPTESAVVASLCEGLSVREIAADRGTGREAVRFHLKNIFQKLGVRRQAEVIRLCSSAPRLSRPGERGKL